MAEEIQINAGDKIIIDQWDSDFPLKENPSYADAVMIMDKDTGKAAKVTVESISLALNQSYGGLATESSSPGAANTWYFAGPGTYTNFPDAASQPIVLTENLNVISWDGTVATVQAVPVDVDTSEFATKAEVDPTIEYTNSLKTQLDIAARIIFSIGDKNGWDAMRINSEAVAIFHEILSNNGITAPNINLQGAKLQYLQNYLFAIDDVDGNMIFAIDSSGKLITNDNSGVIKRNSLGIKRKNIGIFWYGQSLAAGGDGIPMVTTKPVPFAYTFDKGFLTASLNGGTPSKLGSFVPLTPSSFPATPYEVPGLGAADQLSRALIRSGAGSIISDFNMVHASAAVGSSSINLLKKGTPIYNELLQSIQCAFDISGGDFYLPCILWAQGEADYGSINRLDYATLLRQLISDLRADIKSITGQTEEIHFFLYQNCGLQTSDMTFYADIPLALTDVMQDENVHSMGPMYMWDYKNTQSSHLKPLDYKRWGSYAGEMVKKVLVDNLRAKPILPDRINQIDVNTIEIEFSNVVGGLTFDTDMVTDPGNYGFQIKNGGTELGISEVGIVKWNTIRITSADDITGGTLTYGLQGLSYNGRTAGNRGNLRDNAGDQSVYSPSDGNIADYPLHNWAMMFSKQI